MMTPSKGYRPASGPDRSDTAARMSRRHILRAGVQAPILFGLGTGLVRQAMGAPSGRQGLITLVSGAAFPTKQLNLSQEKVNSFFAEEAKQDPTYWQKRPALAQALATYAEKYGKLGVLSEGILARLAKSGTKETLRIDLANEELVGPFGTFSSRKDRLVFFNRLYATGGNSEIGGWSHGGGMRVLTANGTGKDPHNISIDQHIANVIGKNTVESSIRITVDTHSASTFGGKPEGFRNFVAGNFAAGPNANLPGYANPQLMFKDLFGLAPTSGKPAEDFRTGLRGKVFDALSQDIKLLSRALAGTEREKLDQYLGEFEQFSKRQQAQLQVTCAAPVGPTGISADAHTQATTMIELGALAMRCGMTNVLSIALGTLSSSHEPMWTHRGFPFGHNPVHYGACYEFWMDYAPLLARILDSFEQVKVDGGASLADRTAVMMMGDCGVCEYGQHVAEMKPQWIGCGPKFPIVLIAPKGVMKNTGQIVQYPYMPGFAQSQLATSGCMSQASVFATLGTAMGAPGFVGNPLAHTKVLDDFLA